jgi:hypothetical protein
MKWFDFAHGLWKCSAIQFWKTVTAGGAGLLYYLRLGSTYGGTGILVMALSLEIVILPCKNCSNSSLLNLQL